ncbi:glycosyltransferase family 2 protein [Thermodesulfobacteriota bacterium]
MTCYNRRDTTLECLRCLYAQKLPEGVRFEVYLVDDGCTDSTSDAVRDQFPDVCVFQVDGNLYWCGGMRFAWAEAMKGDYDAYLWLNDDTMLLPGALYTLLVTAHDVRQREGRDGIIVGSCRDPKTGKHTYGGRVNPNQRARLPDKPLPPGDEMLPCDTMNGNLVLIPRELFNQLGNLSPEFTHAFGDVDYGMRARRSSVLIWVAPGHLAECAANTGMRPWTVSSVPLKERWRDMCGPRGLPPRQWYLYVKRHTGAAWPFYFLKPIVRVIFPRLWRAIRSKHSSIPLETLDTMRESKCE